MFVTEFGLGWRHACVARQRTIDKLVWRQQTAQTEAIEVDAMQLAAGALDGFDRFLRRRRQLERERCGKLLGALCRMSCGVCNDKINAPSTTV